MTCDGEADGGILGRLSPAEQKLVLESIDDSDYSQADWEEALAAFDGWLADRGETRRSWAQIVGYVHCCTLMASPGIPLGNLKVIVLQVLTEFGFDFLGDSQA